MDTRAPRTLKDGLQLVLHSKPVERVLKSKTALAVLDRAWEVIASIQEIGRSDGKDGAPRISRPHDEELLDGFRQLQDTGGRTEPEPRLSKPAHTKKGKTMNPEVVRRAGKKSGDFKARRGQKH